MQFVAVIINFIYGQVIFFKSCDCRSVGVVPANTYIEKVYKIFFIKNAFGGRIRTPTDEECYIQNSGVLSTELLQIMDHLLRFTLLN